MSRSCFLITAILVAGCNASPDPGLPEPNSAEPTPSREPAPPPHPAKPLVDLTPAAAEAIRSHLADIPEAKGASLRVRVVAGGCQGFTHKLDLDMAVSADDTTFESGGVKVVVASRQVELIRGATVDYGREGERTGFIVKNPNFEGACAKRSLDELEKQPAAK